jgi:hypothetical protein
MDVMGRGFLKVSWDVVVLRWVSLLNLLFHAARHQAEIIGTGWEMSTLVIKIGNGKY